MPDTPMTEDRLALARKMVLAMEARDHAAALVEHYRQRLLNSIDVGQPDTADDEMLAAVEKLRLVVEDSDQQ